VGKARTDESWHDTGEKEKMNAQFTEKVTRSEKNHFFLAMKSKADSFIIHHVRSDVEFSPEMRYSGPPRQLTYFKLRSFSNFPTK